MSMKIIIIGGGFGGLEASFSLKSLIGDAAEITLIDKNPFHSFIPSIHEVSSGKISPRSIQIPFNTILSPAGIQFVQEDVQEIDRIKGRVIAGRKSLLYDFLVLATGAQNNFFNVPGAEEFSYRFRSPEDADRIYQALTRLLSEHRRPTHIVLAGGGTEGVEAAGEIIDLIHDSGYAADLLTNKVTVTLIERKSHVLPGFPVKAREFTDHYLQNRGVQLVTGKCVTAVQEASLLLDPKTELFYSLLIWTGGIKPSRLIESLDLPKETAGWLIVTDKLNSPIDDRIFAVGDAVSIHDDNGPIMLERLAYHAQDQAIIASLNISYQIKGKQLIRFRPRTKPKLISLGRDMGVYTRADHFSSGAWVVGLKKTVERRHLLTYLSKPVLSLIPVRIPRSDLIWRMRLKLPF